MSNNQENGEAGVSNSVNNEDVYEKYGGDYAEYDRTSSRSINAKFKDKSVWKRKWWFIGLAFVLIIISIAIGLGIHFGTTSGTTLIPQTLSTSVATPSTSVATPSTSVAPFSTSVAPNSQSSTTDRSETVVLSLSTYLPSNVPMLIGLSGMTFFILNFHINCFLQVKLVMI